MSAGSQDGIFGSTSSTPKLVNLFLWYSIK